MNLGIIKKYLGEQEEANQIGELSKHNQVTVFCNIFGGSSESQFSVMQMIEAFNFKGIFITNELDCLLYMNNLGLKEDYYYYCDSTEWFKMPNLSYKFMASTLLQENLKILVKSTREQDTLFMLTGNKYPIVGGWSSIGENL